MLSNLSQNLTVYSNAAQAPQKLLLSVASKSQSLPCQDASSKMRLEIQLCCFPQLPGLQNEMDRLIFLLVQALIKPQVSRKDPVGEAALSHCYP